MSNMFNKENGAAEKHVSAYYMHQTTYTNLIGLLLFVGFAIGVNFLVYSQF